MKKLLTLILAITLMVNVAVPSFAAEVDQDTVDKKSETVVSFNVNPTYIITIPANVTLDKKTAQDGTITYENDYTITAEAGMRLFRGEYIEVTIASDFTMETKEHAWLDYVILNAEGDEVANNGVVATFETDKNEQSAAIHLAANDPDYAGEYEDTVIFTVSVEKSNMPG